MACILRSHARDSCGVLVVTTQERDHQIKDDPKLRGAIEGLKDRWMIGLHHNWHDWKFQYDPLFDFSMAGDGDLVEVSGKEFPRIPMDACNFVPNCFHPETSQKFWDILYVARAVKFKCIPKFFDMVRQLYDRGHKYRVLLISSLPPYDPKEEKTTFYGIQEVYKKMFSESEQDLFTLLGVGCRYPFPFDRETLAHFYRSSKVFVHAASDERRCRVAGYAWASGLPVVGMECVAGLLPPEVRRAPYFFESRCYADFPDQIIKAISSLPLQNWDKTLMETIFSISCTSGVLDQWLLEMAQLRGLLYQTGHLSNANLDFRLGRHHTSSINLNSVGITLSDFVRWLSRNNDKLSTFLDSQDPESAIQASTVPTGVTKLLGRVFSRA